MLARLCIQPKPRTTCQVLINLILMVLFQWRKPWKFVRNHSADGAGSPTHTASISLIPAMFALISIIRFTHSRTMHGPVVSVYTRMHRRVEVEENGQQVNKRQSIRKTVLFCFFFSFIRDWYILARGSAPALLHSFVLFSLVFGNIRRHLVWHNYWIFGTSVSSELSFWPFLATPINYRFWLSDLRKTRTNETYCSL